MAFEKTVPQWDATGTEPPSSLKTSGFTAGYKPPADYFNWFFNGISKAVSELQSKAITSDDHKIKSYTSLGSIGIGIGGETVQSIFNSLSAGSEISYYVNASNRQSVYPDYGDTNKIGLCRCYKVNSSFMEMTFFRTGNSGGVVQRWYAYYSATNGFSGWKEIAFSTNGTVTSSNADYAEVGEWADGNTADEDRIGYFVAVDPSTAGTTMIKATSTTDVRGVTVSAPAFSGNCSADKFDAETGALLKQYDFVAVMGLVSVIDNGTCTINGRCMPNDNGTAVPSSNNMGYQVIDRIDDTHILIAVEPSADMIQRIKTDVVELQKRPNPNLLDNPWFTVNQRGKQKYTTTDDFGKITLDRWRFDGGSFSIVPNSPYGVHMEDCTGSAQIAQIFPSSYLVIGKTYTYSVNVNGTIYSTSGVYTGPSEEAYHSYFSINKDGIGLEFRQHNLESDKIQVVFGFTRTQPFYVYAFKLELGSVSTLAYDTPPNYQQELAKCQRYFVRLNCAVDTPLYVGACTGNTQFDGCIKLPVPMRTVPTFRANNPTSFKIYNGKTSTKINSNGGNNQMLWIRTVLNGSLTTGYGDILYATEDATFDISADL